MRRLLHISILFIVIGLLISCGSDSSSTGPDSNPDSDPDPEPTTGTVEISTSTSGDDQDDDGYKVTLGNNEKDISSNETISFDNLDEGSYDAELSNIAGNCSVDGDNPRSITVTAGETTSATFEIQCQEIQPVAQQEAVDAVKQVMQNKGWTAPSKSVNDDQTPTTANSDPNIFDFIATEVNDSGTRVVYMLIGPDGHLIPTSEWQSNNQGKCKQESLRYMKAAQKRFNFKMFSLADGYDVFAQYIDIATSEIEAQREGQSSSLVDAITTAWDKIEKPVKKPADPCGDKISNLTLTFSAITTLESISKESSSLSSTIKEQVEATVELNYDKQDSMYTGSGDLTWANYNHSELNCELPDPARLKVHKFVYGDPTTTNGETELQIQFHDMKKNSCNIHPNFSFSWWLLHENEIHKEVELDEWAITVEDIYALHNWEAVEVSPVIVVQKQYDHSRTVEDEDSINNVSGESMIRILHETNE
ncbi:hypothetical protein [Fodinibius sp.]|uniref:hypothetical protein n=1 Tax=Fodinibius sp. TaxID=1872440 RepID=UPI002ACDDF52|nr:hypothetical protein [Fodinibius sp.]MDZ7657911.1 hypothetical protein [Fodinibius sp.]